MKRVNRAFAYILSCALAINFQTGNEINNKPVYGAEVEGKIPVANSSLDSIGATMPYLRYDSNEAAIGGGAVIANSNNFYNDNIASQASEQSYIRLPKSGAYAEWIVEEDAKGFTIRFTMPDHEDGYGLEGSLDVYVNNKKVKTLELTSYYMWQYFYDGTLYDEAPGTAAFAFDETHFLYNTGFKKGDIIKIQSTGASGIEYGVDFVELEAVGSAMSKPSGALSVTDYGAVANDGKSDYSAIINCINAANQQKKTVYIPVGTFDIDRMLRINASDIKITGAGMWYTNIQFTRSTQSGGGISGSNANNVEFCNMYINSNLRSRYGENAVYKCFMDVWSGCYIHDIWEEHFECGFWLADYSSPVEYCDNTVIADCRIRNNFADGVNFCQGTSNSVVYNCSVRNNGDDGLAMWNNNYLSAKDEVNNVFCYNTIEFIWRAGGIAIYGGSGHNIYNNYIADTYMASGIHLNTVFPGHRFTNNTGITFSNNILVRCGTSQDCFNGQLAAIDMSGELKNITFNNTYIYDAQHDGIRLVDNSTGIVFNNLQVFGCGADGRVAAGNNPGALFRFYNQYSSQNVTVNGLKYANIPYSSIIFGTRNNCTISGETNYGKSYSYVAPKGTVNSITKTSQAEIKGANSSNKPSSPNKEEETTQSRNNIKNKVKKTKAVITKTKRAKSNKKMKITIKKISFADGYQIKYSTKKSMKKKVKYLNSTKRKKYVKNLKVKKKYYVRVRCYKVINGVKVYGKWSNKKTVKVRKK